MRQKYFAKSEMQHIREYVLCCNVQKSAQKNEKLNNLNIDLSVINGFVILTLDSTNLMCFVGVLLSLLIAVLQFSVQTQQQNSHKGTRV